MTDAAILAAIKRSEGWPRYTNDPVDAGGPTKGGVTLATLRAWRRGPVSVEDLKALTETEADAIYQFMYLQPFAAIPDAKLRHLLIDLGVLRGPRAAGIMLQEILGVTADGWIGPQTLGALKGFNAAQVRVMLVGSRLAHIASRVRQSPSQSRFVKGWRVRTLAFLS